MGRKLGATTRFGKAAEHPIIVVLRARCVHPAGRRTGRAGFARTASGSKKPGLTARASLNIEINQAAGL